MHWYGAGSYSINAFGQVTGFWQPDGRHVDPETSTGADLENAPRAALLNIFNGQDASGTWTLYVADVPGGWTSTLNGWGLELTIIPEPGTGVLALNGLVFAAGRALRRRRAAQ